MKQASPHAARLGASALANPWRRKLLAGSALIVCIAAFGKVAANHRRQVEIRPLPESRILRSMEKDGNLYKLADDGNVYRVADAGKQWSYVETVFDPQAIAR